MTKTTRRGKYSGAELFVAFELGNKDWKLASGTELGSKPRLRTVPARDLVALEQELAAAKKHFRLGRDVQVISCYEAGRDGFWLHRLLVSMGVRNLVVDSASIEVSRRARRAKSDKLDARKLLMQLMRHEAGETKVWSVVRVPKVEEEDRRQQDRGLQTRKQERTRVTNRIKGLLANHGIRLEKIRELPQQLDTLRLWDGSLLPPGLRRRLEQESEHWSFLQGQIVEIEAARRREQATSRQRAMRQVRQLQALRGIGEGGSSVFVHEFFGWRTFRNRKQVGSLAGLAPTPHQSGDGSYEKGISKAGNRHVRAMAVQLAWSWLRYQPKSRLSRWFRKRFGRGGSRARRVGIVAVARKLLIALWRFLEDGIVPEGAVLQTV